MRTTQLSALLMVMFLSACDTTTEENNMPDSNMDSSFGNMGQVNTEMDSQSTQSQIQRILIDNNDRIYAIGWLGDSANSMAVARYTADGALDTTFNANGTPGKLVTDFGDRFSPTDAVFNSNGKLIISGHAQNQSLQSLTDMAIAVVNTDGTIDTTFDNDGRLNLDVNPMITAGVSGSSFDHAYGIATSSTDGAFYLAGDSSYNSAEKNSVVIKLDSNLSIVSSYGTNGAALTDFISSQAEIAFDVSETQGQAIVVGSTANASSGQDFFIGKLDSAGAVEFGFDTDGVITVDFSGSDDWAEKILLTDNNTSAIAIGWTSSGSGDTVDTDLAMVKFDVASGALDTSFGTNGKVVFQLNNENTFSSIRDKSLAAVIDTNGKIVVACSNGLTEYKSMSVFRFNTDGSSDTTFGNNGILAVPSGADADVGSAKAIGIQSSGKIVAGGQKGANNDRHFHLVRFDND